MNGQHIKPVKLTVRLNFEHGWPESVLIFFKLYFGINKTHYCGRNLIQSNQGKWFQSAVICQSLSVMKMAPILFQKFQFVLVGDNASPLSLSIDPWKNMTWTLTRELAHVCSVGVTLCIYM